MARNRTTQDHTTLINELCKACTEDVLTELKTHVKAKDFGGLRAGEIEKLKSLRDLLDKLEKKRVFKQGKYEKLKNLFEQAEFSEGTEIIDDITENAEPMDQGDSQGAIVNSNRSSSSSGLQTHQPHGQTAATGQFQSSRLAALPHHQTIDQDDASPILPEGDDLYENGRGYLLFINNFVEKGDAKWRDGATVDEQNIRSVFQEFIKTFAIQIRRDLTKQALMQLLDDVSGELQRNNFKSFIFIICSHGEQHEVTDENTKQKAYKEGFLTIDDELVTEDEITEKFEADKVPKLKGCPKVFIFQCCRGRAFGRGVLDRADSTEVQPAAFSAGPVIDMSDNVQPKKLPTNADMLIAHSTSKGTKAWRNNVDGSWFIKCFCDVLKLFHKRDHLLDMLVRVNSQVAERESTEQGAKQMPCQVSTFTKKFKLGVQ